MNLYKQLENILNTVYSVPRLKDYEWEDLRVGDNRVGAATITTGAGRESLRRWLMECGAKVISLKAVGWHQWRVTFKAVSAEEMMG